MHSWVRALSLSLTHTHTYTRTRVMCVWEKEREKTRVKVHFVQGVPVVFGRVEGHDVFLRRRLRVGHALPRLFAA